MFFVIEACRGVISGEGGCYRQGVNPETGNRDRGNWPDPGFKDVKAFSSWQWRSQRGTPRTPPPLKWEKLLYKNEVISEGFYL